MKKFVFLLFVPFFLVCKDISFFEASYNTTEKNYKSIDLTFFCNPSGEKRYVSYFSKETKIPLEELKTAFYCTRHVSNSSMYQLGIISPKTNNNVVIVIGGFSCKKEICTLVEESREHVGEEPDGKLVFQVIHQDVIKLISSNIKEINFQDNENNIVPYEKAEPFFNSKEDHYFYREPEDIVIKCSLEQIRVDIFGRKGVYCLSSTEK